MPDSKLNALEQLLVDKYGVPEDQAVTLSDAIINNDLKDSQSKYLKEEALGKAASQAVGQMGRITKFVDTASGKDSSIAGQKIYDNFLNYSKGQTKNLAAGLQAQENAKIEKLSGLELARIASLLASTEDAKDVANKFYADEPQLTEQEYRRSVDLAEYPRQHQLPAGSTTPLPYNYAVVGLGQPGVATGPAREQEKYNQLSAQTYQAQNPYEVRLKRAMAARKAMLGQ